jgi:plastocyanin domain-containing protein
MKTNIISILVGLALIGGALAIVPGGSKKDGGASANNVSISEGEQIIEIKAKGGYFPRRVVAKAGIHTIIRFATEGTFDCSSSVLIPRLNINENFPISGTTDIDLGSPEAGTLQGSCGMGMYPFEIEFQD